MVSFLADYLPHLSLFQTNHGYFIGCYYPMKGKTLSRVSEVSAIVIYRVDIPLNAGGQHLRLNTGIRTVLDSRRRLWVEVYKSQHMPQLPLGI